MPNRQIWGKLIPLPSGLLPSHYPLPWTPSTKLTGVGGGLEGFVYLDGKRSWFLGPNSWEPLTPAKHLLCPGGIFSPLLRGNWGHKSSPGKVKRQIKELRHLKKKKKLKKKIPRTTGSWSGSSHRRWKYLRVMLRAEAKGRGRSRDIQPLWWWSCHPTFCPPFSFCRVTSACWPSPVHSQGFQEHLCLNRHMQAAIWTHTTFSHVPPDLSMHAHTYTCSCGLMLVHGEPVYAHRGREGKLSETYCVHNCRESESGTVGPSCHWLSLTTPFSGVQASDGVWLKGFSECVPHPLPTQGDPPWEVSWRYSSLNFWSHILNLKNYKDPKKFLLMCVKSINIVALFSICTNLSAVVLVA